MNSICRLIPVKSDGGNLKTVHFVYETEWGRLRQPMTRPIYYLYLVTRGSGELSLPEFGTHRIEVGSLIFMPPGVRHRIAGSNDLAYLYISFMGSRAQELATEWKISMEHPVYDGFEDLIPLWRQALQRLNAQNANLLTEGVLLHTLSYLAEDRSPSPNAKNDTVLQNILNYTEQNFGDPTINLKHVADLFGYTDKYLSHLFKSRMSINFTTYLNRLRIRHAAKLLEEGYNNIADLATVCGYSDPMYFSKVFRRVTGKTPREYRKRDTE